MKYGTKYVGGLVVVVACAAGTACYNSESPETAPSGAYGGGPSNLSKAAKAGDGGAIAGVPINATGAQPPSGGQPMVFGRGGGPAHLTDGQIGAVTTAVNQGEIQQGQLAATRARNPEVRQFAQSMVQEHQSMQQHQQQLLGRSGLAPADNDVSRRLSQDGQGILQQLQSATGDEFDRRYIDAQVREHEQALQTVEHVLVPDAQNAQLRQSLTEMRTHINMHLDEARRIQQSLAGGTGGMGGMGGGNINAPAPQTGTPQSPGMRGGQNMMR